MSDPRWAERWWAGCPEHGQAEQPSGSCHECAMLMPEPPEDATAHEETRARQTGATVSQLRAEQQAAEELAVDTQMLSRIAQWLDHKREAGDTSYEIACQLFGAVEASSGHEAAVKFHDNLDQDLTEDEEEGKR